MMKTIVRTTETVILSVWADVWIDLAAITKDQLVDAVSVDMSNCCCCDFFMNENKPRVRRAIMNGDQSKWNEHFGIH